MFRENLQLNQNYRGQNYRGGYRRNYRNDNYERGEVGPGIDSIPIISGGMIEVIVGLDQGSRTSMKRDRIRCKCREYDQFAKDCSTCKVEKNQNKFNKCTIWTKNKPH